jgi:hypothetical protein
MEGSRKISNGGMDEVGRHEIAMAPGHAEKEEGGEDEAAYAHE